MPQPLKEKWNPLWFCNAKYHVSSEGRIKSIYSISKTGKIRLTNKILSPTVKDGYEKVLLYWIMNGKKFKSSFRLHRLIAEAFIPNPQGKPQVNHINGIKSDNHFKNLEWVTNKENSIHAQSIGLVPIAKERIKTGYNNQCRMVINIETGQRFNSVRQLAELTNMLPNYYWQRLGGHTKNNTPYKYA